MRPLRTTVVVGLAAAIVATQAPAQTKSAEDDFLSWARPALHPVSTASGAPQADLEPFRQIVGNARVVAVGEGLHGTAEGMAFRNRLFRYLVENLGFRVIAIESGITEGRVVHDYVAGTSGDLGTVMQQGVSWGFDRFPQNEELVKWMREWNADPRHQQKLEFFGFDVPGSAGNPFGRRDVRTALEETLSYLARVDATNEQMFRGRLASVWSRIRMVPDAAYTQLSEAERDHLTAVIADLVSLMEKKEAAYTRATSSTDYQWNYRNAIGARQADTLLRKMPIGQSGNDEALWDSVWDGWELRDHAMADNLRWIAEQTGSAKMLVFAHTTHLAGTTIVRRIPASELPGVPRTLPKDIRLEPFGTYLRRQYGRNLVAIGGLIVEGAAACKDYSSVHTVPMTTPTFESTLIKLGVSSFTLDLRTAPSPVAAWLGSEHTLWGGLGDTTLLPLKQAFDAVFFSRTITPACAASTNTPGRG
jgi:erythromycin esterase